MDAGEKSKYFGYLKAKFLLLFIREEIISYLPAITAVS